MIFVTLGSQKFQFNRLLKAIDEQIAEGKITDCIFAQIGYSDYKPNNYKFKQFLDREEFVHMQEKATIVIAHGGTGAIVGALKNGKKVIAVPRLAKYGEHVDDHQLQIVRQFSELNLISECYDCQVLYSVVDSIKQLNFCKYISNTQKIIDSIDLFING